VSKKIALPATAASEGLLCAGAVVAESLPPPPHPESAHARSPIARQGPMRLAFIRLGSAQIRTLNAFANAIENYSHLQTAVTLHDILLNERRLRMNPVWI
jgi:hypothetical protein